ncbi:MAG TPA: hypothetical protein VIE64_08235 [Solirubrobacterales bacterium]
MNPTVRQLVLICGALLLASVWIVPIAELLMPILQAGAVLAIALIGFWMIVTAPFRRGG